MQTLSDATPSSSLPSAEDAAPPSSAAIGLERRRKLRIVHIVSSLLGGGMEHVVVRLAEAQRRGGHTVSVVALRSGPLLAPAVEAGLFVFVPTARGKALRSVQVATMIARFRPDIIHAHNPTSLHYAALGKAISRARLVMTDHAQTRGVIRVPTRREARLTDAVVAVSQATAVQRQAVDRPGTLSVIHNGVDPPAGRRSRSQVRSALGLSEGTFGIMVAGMDPVKGHDTLLSALALLDREDISVLVVGDGGERQNLERLASELHLSPERVRFLGFRPDVSDLMAASDFFVLPSRMEGFPIAILEAMVHGLPTIATPVGGVPELVVDGEHGLLVRPDDPAALAVAIIRLADDPTLRVRQGRAASCHVRDRFSFDLMTKKYEMLYLSLGTAGRSA